MASFTYFNTHPRAMDKATAVPAGSAFTFAKDKVPAPFVCNTCPFVPSVVGNVNAFTKEVRLLSYACTSVPIVRPKDVFNVAPDSTTK